MNLSLKFFSNSALAICTPLSLLILISLSQYSSAYIPDYTLITSHAADKHGNGAYLIEQDVTFKREGESYSVRETWIVANEGAMRVTLEGKGPLRGVVQGTMVYDYGQKLFVSPDGSGVRSQRLGQEWLEPLFHFRSSKYFRSRLVQLGIVQTENFDKSKIRLSRAGGAINWAIGAPPSESPVPTIWIEQDQFVTRKLRTPNQVVLSANDYIKYKNSDSAESGIWYPRQRLYNFGNYQVEVQTVKVKSIGKLRPDDKSFKASSLVPQKDALKLPEVDGLREFYARFR